MHLPAGWHGLRSLLFPSVAKDLVHGVAKPEPLVAKLDHRLVAGSTEPVVTSWCAGRRIAPFRLDETFGTHPAQKGIDGALADQDLSLRAQELDHLTAVERRLPQHRQHAVLDNAFAKLRCEPIDRHQTVL